MNEVDRELLAFGITFALGMLGWAGLMAYVIS